MKIVLIHGFKASSQTGFFPWLKDELHKLGHEVIVPDLPQPDSPDPEAWTKALLEEVGTVDEQTIVVGHSLGGTMALRFLEAVEAVSTPKACILIGTPWMIKDEKFRGFFMSELDFDVLMWKAARFVVLHSRDDKVIPFDHAEKYVKVLHGKLVERNNGEGHFNKAEKYPVILELIKKVVDAELVYDPGEGLENQYETIEY